MPTSLGRLRKRMGSKKWALIESLRDERSWRHQVAVLWNLKGTTQRCIYTLCSSMTSLYSQCKDIVNNLMQQCEEVEFNRCLCKLIAKTYMDSLVDLEKCLLKSDVEIDTKMLDSCRQVLAELCCVMCCGERLAKDWSNKDWWRSTVSSSDSASVQKRVELHLKEFLSCVKVLKIAIAEASGDSAFDLSTIEHSQLLMSDIEIAFEEDRKELFQHVQEMEITQGTCGEGYELAKYLPERCNLKSQDSISCQNLDIFEDEVLGEGAFGKVCKCKVFGLMAAAKFFKHGEDTAKAVEDEIKLFARLQHPNVVQCIGHVLTERGPVLVSELMTEDLRSYLDREVHMDTNEEKPLPLLVVLDIMLQIAEGMNYLHENDVMHRDLKAKNVLINAVKNEENLELSSSKVVKIADFGLAKLNENNQYSTKDLGWCFEEGLKGNLPIEVYSVVVFNTIENEKGKLGDGKHIYSVSAQLEAAKYFANWNNRWQDADKAFKLFWNLAKGFHPEALYRVGWCFEHGFGTKQNNQSACKYYLRAFHWGYDCASVELGWCYATGRGVDQNHNLEKSMLKKALAAQKERQIRLPCITEMLQQLDHPSKSPDATRPQVMDVLKRYQDTCRLKLDFIQGSSIGKKLIPDLFHSSDSLGESTIVTDSLREQKTMDAIDLLDRVPGIKDFSELSLAKMTVLEAYQGAVNGATYGELVVGELKRPVSDIPYLADQDHHL
ncbi:unnamed protein product [Sphagnum jensenii]